MHAGFLAPLVRPSTAPLHLVRDDGLLIAEQLEAAFDSPSRRRGLLGRAEFPANAALILAPCAAVHTCFMRFPIDLLFTARDGRITSVRGGVAPWRAAGSLRAFAVIELAAGRVQSLGVGAGDLVRIEPCGTRTPL